MRRRIAGWMAISQPTTIAGTGAIKHVGSFRIWARVYTASEAARIRLSYRVARRV